MVREHKKLCNIGACDNVALDFGKCFSACVQLICSKDCPACVRKATAQEIFDRIENLYPNTLKLAGFIILKRDVIASLKAEYLGEGK